MNILGITHKYAYNQAACLISDGRLVAFAEEERFTREKQAPQQFPSNAIKYCLKIGNLESWEISIITDISSEIHHRLTDARIQEAVLRPFFSMYLSLCEDAAGFYRKPIT